MRIHRLRHDQSGQTATEFALVLPVFCLLLFAVIQFGILFNNYLTLTDAVRAGARAGAVSRHEPSPAGTAEARVRSAAGSLEADDLDVSVTAPGGWDHGKDVTVEASYPYEISLLGFTAASGRLSSETTERIE